MGGKRNGGAQDQRKEIKIDKWTRQENMASTFSLSFGGWKLERWLRLISDFFHAGLSYATFTSVVNGTQFVPMTFRVIGFIWFPGLPSCASGIFFTPSQGLETPKAKMKPCVEMQQACMLSSSFGEVVQWFPKLISSFLRVVSSVSPLGWDQRKRQVR